LVGPPLLDDLACCFACLAGEVVVAAVGVVCDVVVGVLATAAAGDLVVLDFDPLPPQAAIPTATAPQQSTLTIDRNPAFLGGRNPAPTIAKNYSP
jgi:hypothetical protein